MNLAYWIPDLKLVLTADLNDLNADLIGLCNWLITFFYLQSFRQKNENCFKGLS